MQVVLTVFVVLTVAPFVRAALTSSFWSPEHSMAPVASLLFFGLVAAVVVGRFRWAWVLLVLFEAGGLVSWAIDPTPFHVSDVPFYVAAVGSFLLLLSPTIRHRLRKPVRFRVAVNRAP
jgi:hypothetical protein